MVIITTTPLREQMRRALRIRNVSSRTEYTYIHMVAGFAAHFRRSPDRWTAIRFAPAMKTAPSGSAVAWKPA